MGIGMKLYLVHCGFYDLEILDGVYESHVNFLVAAESFEDARAKVRLEPDFSRKKMHVDGLQEVRAVNGHRVDLTADSAFQGKTEILSSRHRDLAPKKPAEPNPV